MFHHFGCVSLDFIPVDQAEISRMNRQQNSSQLPGSYREVLRVFIWERFPARPAAEISVVAGPARLLIRTNRNVYEENSGEARSRKPGSYDYYIVKTH